MGQRLGQHFLKNRDAITRIVAAIDIQTGETVVEIGPGQGALTQLALESCETVGAKLIAIEKDDRLASTLRGRLASTNAEIRTGDILSELPKLRLGGEYKLVGNLPYYLSGKLLRIISELENKPELCVFMLQKEVAERLCAEPPKMNLLAAAVQFWAEAEILFTLAPADFSPPPKVESAVVRLKTKGGKLKIGEKEEENYYRTIRAIFKQPRKQVLNNLADGLKIPKVEAEQILARAGIDPTARGQNLSIGDLVRLAQNIPR